MKNIFLKYKNKKILFSTRYTCPAKAAVPGGPLMTTPYQLSWTNWVLAQNKCPVRALNPTKKFWASSDHAKKFYWAHLRPSNKSNHRSFVVGASYLVQIFFFFMVLKRLEWEYRIDILLVVCRQLYNFFQ
jgi:hypothetical protein